MEANILNLRAYLSSFLLFMRIFDTSDKVLIHLLLDTLPECGVKGIVARKAIDVLS
jgi:hypothetical protein